MTKIAVIYGSSRPSTVSKAVAEWFNSKVDVPEGSSVEMIDLAEVNLPLLAEPQSPMMGDYQLDTTKAWAEKIGAFDAFVIVVAEYNKSMTPLLKNALDTLFAEWNDKKAATISYGFFPESTAVKHLHDSFGMLKIVATDAAIHLTPVNEAVTAEGVDESKATGSTPQEVLDSLL